jgi:hypothetical protein
MTPPTPGRYRHFKGNEYEVLGVATHSETHEPLVVYRPLYGGGGLWVRPLALFADRVERDGYAGPRFVKINDG